MNSLAVAAFALLPFSLAESWTQNCEMSIYFHNPCDVVKAEMSTRVSRAGPSHESYRLLQWNSSSISAQHLTKSRAVDRTFDFFFTSSLDGCNVDVSSQSLMSNDVDKLASYCYVHSLYSSDRDLVFAEARSTCGQYIPADCATATRKSASDSNQPSQECVEDLLSLALHVSQAAVAGADAYNDCADDFTSQCNEDVDKMLTALSLAGIDATKAYYDCGENAPNECLNDITAITEDIASATLYLTDAYIDCQADSQKCNEDISAAAKVIQQTVADIGKARADCHRS